MKPDSIKATVKEELFKRGAVRPELPMPTRANDL